MTRTTDRRPDPLWRTLVGTVLRAERLLQGLTLREVAAAAGISVPYLSEIERGRKEASSEMLAAAAAALGLRLLDLLERAHRALAEREDAVGAVTMVRSVASVTSVATVTSSAPAAAPVAGCSLRLAA